DGPYKKVAKFYNKNELNQVINLCKTADLVVLYDLDILKCKIALALPDNVKIAWRFFGHELYSRMQHEVLSDKSLSFTDNSLNKAARNFLRPLYYKIKYGEDLKTLFQKAVSRFDYMFILSRNEYDYL